MNKSIPNLISECVNSQVTVNLKGNGKRTRFLAVEFIHGLKVDNRKEISNGFDRVKDTCSRIEIVN